MDRSRTDELLLYCLHVPPDEAGDGQPETLSSPDWDALIAESGRYGVAPLLYHRLRTSHSDIPVPDNAMERLRHIYLQSAGRALQQYHELGRVLAQLRRAHIPVIVLKGAHSAALVYRNIAIRPMGDVDILVHEDDLMEVEAALLSMGYAPEKRNRQIAEDICHFAYGLPQSDFFVEVHWQLLPSLYRLNIDHDGLWERSRPASIAGTEVAVLCPEDVLLYLSLHASRHHLFEMGLKQFCDVDETIRCHGDEIDWQQVARRSMQWGAGKSVYLTLRLAVELVGASVPDDLMRAIKPGDFDERFLLLAKERILAYGQWHADGVELSPKLAQLWGSNRVLNKVALLLRRALPSREEMARTYSASPDSIRIYGYYPVRIKALVMRHGRQVWRLLRRNEGMRGLAEQENKMARLEEWLMVR